MDERTIAAAYAEYRPLLFSIAYRMLGVAADAEDIVQDVFSAIHSYGVSSVREMKPYLCKMTMNRCLNELKSARKRRETYVGPWLPEPLIGSANEPLEAVEQKETLSYAFQVMLDRLTPLERAVFVLRTAYELEYAEIAAIMERAEAYCRKLVSNARRKLEAKPEAQVKAQLIVQAKGANPEPASAGFYAAGSGEYIGRQGLERFLEAFSQRDIPQLVALLSEDAVLLTDGGGRVRAALKPIITRDRVIALLDVIASRSLFGVSADILQVNGQEAVVFYEGAQRVKAVICLEWSPMLNTVQTIYHICNPDKLLRVKM